MLFRSEVDGNDVVEVYRIAAECVARGRKGGGPSLIECKTYRTRAHAEGMGDFTYRTREEVDHWKTLCPIARLRRHLLEKGLASESDIGAVEAEVESAWTTLKERFALGDLYFVPGSSNQEAAIPSWGDTAFPIHDPAEVDYEAYNPTVGYGYLRLYNLEIGRAHV